MIKMEKRLNKFLSEKGYCSRREADRLIEKNVVFVNDVVATIGTKVQEGDKVVVNGKLIDNEVELVYIALHKPAGITCSTNPKIKKNIIDFMKYPKRIFHVGRLDKDSEGLIFMTNDGDIVNKILRSGNMHEKEYVVRVDQPITPEFLEGMRNGVPILDTVTKKCVVSQVDDFTFRIVLTEGLNRQIRRMVKYFDYKVYNLLRTRIMNVSLDIDKGKWRYLSDEELKRLKQLVETSVKTEEASIK
jgi:23S rRNA pseudouridine2604 synthase